ncbi:hypothetical protein EH243_11705 [Amphritea opalescens]|uniref:NIPSNAP domain-containing protein n=1 Tax=Amphritea opalescens TaxID=2490544 RepID=A0A430KQ22_9GAMM|nr:NIPSNAP family protein [Amphritea opalescens]RTE65598.1 hypothetical protein EH243_11705 [Amphritea opalescens]
MKIIELREYKIKPGKTDQWLDWMREELLPYQESKGMRIINTYIHQDPDGTDYFIWLREFDDEASRQAIYQSTYNQWWITEVRPKVFELIEEESIQVKLMHPLS